MRFQDDCKVRKNRQGRQERQGEERLETSGLSSPHLFFLAILAHLAVQKIDFAILLPWGFPLALDHCQHVGKAKMA